LETGLEPWKNGGVKLLRLNGIWPVLVLLAGTLSLLYLWFSLFPGRVAPETWQYFSAGQVDLGRQYNKIQEPPSSFYPPPFKVGEPVLQNYAPDYYGHGAAYVQNEDKGPDNRKEPHS
jgi:hypothetical protein